MTATGRQQAEQAAIAELLQFRDLYNNGGLRKIGLGQPRTYNPGERLLLRVAQLARRRVALDADEGAVARREFLDDPSPLRSQGTLYVTDERAVFLGNRRKPLGEWRWNELEATTVIHGYAGVRFIVSGGDDASDAVLHVDRPLVVLDRPPQGVAIQMMQIEAASVLGMGRNYDAWIAGLPERWTN